MISLSNTKKVKELGSIKKLEKYSRKIREVLEKSKDKDVSDAIKLFHKLKTKLGDDIEDDDDDLDLRNGVVFTEVKEVNETPRDVLPRELQSGQAIPSWLSRESNNNVDMKNNLPMVPPGMNIRAPPIRQKGGYTMNIVDLGPDGSDITLNNTEKIAERIKRLQKKVEGM